MPIYVVKAGDTLQRIAMTQCGSESFIQQLVKDNNISNPNLIFAGQQLVINCGEKQADPVNPDPVDEDDPHDPNRDPMKEKQVDPVEDDPKTGGLLTVPYHSQEDSDAKWANNDCGPACVRMMIGWNAVRCGQSDPTNITVNDVTFASGIGKTGFAQFHHLIQAGKRYNLTLVYKNAATIPALEEEVRAGRPVISLVRYGSISQRQNQRFRLGHFVVVVGFDENNIILNDPDWYYPRRNEGAGFRVPRIEFDNAIGAESYKAGNGPYQALFVQV